MSGTNIPHLHRAWEVVPWAGISYSRDGAAVGEFWFWALGMLEPLLRSSDPEFQLRRVPNGWIRATKLLENFPRKMSIFWKSDAHCKWCPGRIWAPIVMKQKDSWPKNVLATTWQYFFRDAPNRKCQGCQKITTSGCRGRCCSHFRLVSIDGGQRRDSHKQWSKPELDSMSGSWHIGFQIGGFTGWLPDEPPSTNHSTKIAVSDEVDVGIWKFKWKNDSQGFASYWHELGIFLLPGGWWVEFNVNICDFWLFWGFLRLPCRCFVFLWFFLIKYSLDINDAKNHISSFII